MHNAHARIHRNGYRQQQQQQICHRANTPNNKHVSIQEVIDKKLAVVDLTASIMCMENKMPMYVFGLNEENSIVKAMSGEFAGTKVTVQLGG